MVLFDEDPVTLIRQTITNFHPSPDLSALSRITTSHHTLASQRALRLTSSAATLTQLSRRLHHLRTTHETESARHDAAAHAAKILRLDTEKFRVAKQASEFEIEGERLEGERRGVRAVLERLEGEGVEGGAEGRGGEQDEVVLKLRLYRGLGIDAERDPETGEWKRAVIRSTTKGDVNVVTLDPSFDRFFYANHFWSSI